MEKPTILILGGANYQVPAIMEAVKQNFYVVTCGYIPSDPGHTYSHEYHNIDISDTETVLKLARQVKADHVLAYVSETAVRTAAEVNHRLGLPGPALNTVKRMTEKDRFRKFQQEHGFNCPAFIGISQKEISMADLSTLHFPLIVKPVDASGSRGVRRIETEQQFIDAAQYALSYSGLKRIIVEEVIERRGPQVTGDGFMYNGRVQFLYLGDHHYDNGTVYPVAYSTSWPTQLTEDKQKQIGKKAERLLLEIGYTNGPFNIDARIGSDGQVYIIEIAPRNGGNFVSQCTFYNTGVNLEECLFRQICGLKPDFTRTQSGYSANYILHSHTGGIYRGLHIPDEFENVIKQKHISAREGERINVYRNLGDALGLLLLEFDDPVRMSETIEALHREITVVVEDDGKYINEVASG